MTDRNRLPNRHQHQVLEIEHWDQAYLVGVGRINDKAPITEVFINTSRSGTQAETLARDSAVLLSIALQYGAPLEVLKGAVARDLDGKPSGPIGKILDVIVSTSSSS